MNVLLTGATTGIGNATLKVLLDSKSIDKIYVISRNEINIVDERLIFLKCDISDERELFKVCENNFADIDVFIANAGCGKFAKVEKFDLLDVRNLFEINLIANFQILKQILPHMKARNHGKIIFISSDADNQGFDEGTAYCASKFGLKGLSKALRVELDGTNIGVTTISPGRVDTNFNGKKEGDRPHSLKALDIANIIQFIISLPERCNVESIEVKSIYE